MRYFWIIFRKFFRLAGKNMCRDCQGYIPTGSNIIDIGCGSGIIGTVFTEFFEAELVGVDVEDWRIDRIPFKDFDGIHIPFKDKSFDVALINYVLHHTLDPVALLEDAKRVTKERLVVYEDLINSLSSRLVSRLHSAATLFIHRGTNKPKFKTDNEWRSIFKDLGLDIVFEKRVSNFPSKRHLFILRV